MFFKICIVFCWMYIFSDFYFRSKLKCCMAHVVYFIINVPERICELTNVVIVTAFWGCSSDTRLLPWKNAKLLSPEREDSGCSFKRGAMHRETRKGWFFSHRHLPSTAKNVDEDFNCLSSFQGEKETSRVSWIQTVLQAHRAVRRISRVISRRVPRGLFCSGEARSTWRLFSLMVSQDLIKQEFPRTSRFLRETI